MNSLLRRTVFLQRFRQNLRYAPSRGMALDDDGGIDSMKTTVSILSQGKDDIIFFNAYSEIGFKLSTGIRVMGPCVVFPRSVLHWNIRGVGDIDEASLSLFTMLEPKLDILVLGVGERENVQKIDPKILTYLRSKRINLEVLPTDQALSTFNFLNLEKRYVAGALIPPSYVADFDTSETRGDIFADDFSFEKEPHFTIPEPDPEELASIAKVQQAIGLPYALRAKATATRKPSSLGGSTHSLEETKDSSMSDESPHEKGKK